MTIEVPIPDDMTPRLEQKARSAGLDREQLVSRELAGPRTFDEILGGFREEVTVSGVSDSELDQFGPAGLARRTRKSTPKIADGRTPATRRVRLYDFSAGRCPTSKSIWACLALAEQGFLLRQPRGE